MNTRPLPEHLKKFILDNFDSVEMLRVLVLLFEDAQKEWPLDLITKELRSFNASIEGRLNCLYQRKILKAPTRPGIHQFVPTSEKMHEMIKELLSYYELKKNSIIELIYTRPENGPES